MKLLFSRLTGQYQSFGTSQKSQLINGTGSWTQLISMLASYELLFCAKYKVGERQCAPNLYQTASAVLMQYKPEDHEHHKVIGHIPASTNDFCMV